ncbi:MAG: tRNA (adenosine(37)-N6)-dimethylallyltransferase MiaA [Arthrobacter sp.]|uniref:tRNA (adenosine(37)-N6)-dimethylallyltransferase MiaA n=1 Tax=unclassified Arthrobacter TaxID=235627 RepID=UPI0026572E3D|nr:tRNA (adenosine(37)-N6)-dimethylallyltransferase MiaA [Micrococcaceae bacterium]
MRPLIAIVGPTATGKSDAAIALARRLDGEIVNADALQFYRGMDIGTAKLAPAERGGVPHHLLDIMDIDDEASVATFQQQAREAIAGIQDRGRLPILVGGSGLYVRAVIDELEFPPTDPTIRRRLEAEAAEDGVAGMRRRLAVADPVSSARDLDERRLVRALEVHELTGRPFSSYMPRRDYRQPTLQLGLDIDRELLHAKVAHRVRTMHETGLLDEVESLAALGLRETRTASRAIGYAQFLQVLEGTATIEQAIESTTVATRRFARRQITWFRADPRVHWFDAADPDLWAALEASVREFEVSPGT